MVCGLMSQRVDRFAAVAGMLAGLLVTLLYMVVNVQVVQQWTGLHPASTVIWGVHPISAGIFGVLAGFIVISVVTIWRGLGPVSKSLTGNAPPGDSGLGL